MMWGCQHGSAAGRSSPGSHRRCPQPKSREQCEPCVSRGRGKTSSCFTASCFPSVPHTPSESERRSLSMRQRQNTSFPQDITSPISRVKQCQSRERFADLRSWRGHRFPLCDTGVETGNITPCWGHIGKGPQQEPRETPQHPPATSGTGSTQEQSTAHARGHLQGHFDPVICRGDDPAAAGWPLQRGRAGRESHKAKLCCSAGCQTR